MIYDRINGLNASEHSEQLGEIEAVKVMPTETAVIVISLKDRNIEIGDRVELSARCRLID